MSALHDIEVETLAGETTTLGAVAEGKAALIVNVASRCALTPQYAELEQLHKELSGRGFTVIGVPCNQFGFQEPGSSESIATFCSATYGVTFPMLAKVKVNGRSQHPLFSALTDVPDGDGKAGRVKWNFEKWLVSPAGEPVARFRPTVVPSDPNLRAAVEAALPG
ncbi:MAG TPA: glutathione peroxidase [Mycobacteriales bacterium]|nr:glutathione peroxidase [Mycobacteriales bacterium]